MKDVNSLSKDELVDLAILLLNGEKVQEIKDRIIGEFYITSYEVSSATFTQLEDHIVHLTGKNINEENIRKIFDTSRELPRFILVRID